jgi:hypothetical protein
VRADLVALSPEAVIALSNAGLVKRALREIAEGQGPALEELEDGTVIGTFADENVARLVPGKTLHETPCTCGAPRTCRHRVAVALAYKGWAGAHATIESWSPAEIDDAALERALGSRKLERARAAAKKRLLVTVEAGEPPTARLPACTVRFLVPRDVAYARCDCAEQGACEHLALAVWAFRLAPRGDGVVVSLGPEKARSERPFDEWAELGRDVVLGGIANGPALTQRFARARARARDERLVWIGSLADDLERVLDLYRARSALYSTGRALALVTELEARMRAVSREGELPHRYLLGEDEAPETLLDHVRLVSLGARVLADGELRTAHVYLADPDTATVLVLEKRFVLEEGSVGTGPALARRTIAPRISLGQAAHGQIVSKVVRRRANRSMTLAGSRTAQTSVTPQRGDYGELPPPILIASLEAHLAAERARPPAFLRPRVLAENVHAVAIGEVHDLSYLPAEQALVAIVRDRAGAPFFVRVVHRAAAPHAVDAAAAALAGPVRFVAGELTRGPHGPTIEPTAIAGAELVVPDLAGATESAPLARTAIKETTDPIDQAIGSAAAALEELLLVGLRHTDPGLEARFRALADRMDAVGLRASAIPIRALADRLGTDPEGAIDPFFDAAIRTELARRGA